MKNKKNRQITIKEGLRIMTLVAIAGSCYNSMPKLEGLISQYQEKITDLTSYQTYELVYFRLPAIVPFAIGLAVYPFLKKFYKQKTL